MVRSLTTTERGYGARHRAERKKWEPRVKAGVVSCHAAECKRADRVLAPDEPWDLGHTEDRTAWTGPEHPECNRADGGRRGNRVARERAQMVVRTWGAA